MVRLSIRGSFCQQASTSQRNQNLLRKGRRRKAHQAPSPPIIRDLQRRLQQDSRSASVKPVSWRHSLRRWLRSRPSRRRKSGKPWRKRRRARRQTLTSQVLKNDILHGNAREKRKPRRPKLVAVHDAISSPCHIESALFHFRPKFLGP